MSKILIVGADPHEVQSVVSIIQKDGHEHSVAPDISEGIRLAKNLPFDSLLLVKNDVRGGGAVQFIKKMKEEVILLPVLVFTDQTPHENNISLCSDMERLMPYGESRGFLYTQKFDKTLLKAIKENLPVRKRSLFDRTRLLPRQSEEAKHLQRQVRTYANYEGNIMIYGEPGTCKPTVAYVLHINSPRRNKPFVEICHCQLALSDNDGSGCERCKLCDSYMKAEKGTLYLRNLHHFCKKGRDTLMAYITAGQYDVRIISSTNPSINEKVKSGEFDGVLFHLLNQYQIDLPPLRKLINDIEPLAKHFLLEFAKLHGTDRCIRISKKALDLLRAHTWPQNALELKMVMFKCAANNYTGTIDIVDLRRFLPDVDLKKVPTKKNSKLRKWYADHFAGGGTIEEAAGLRGVTERTVYNQLSRCGLNPKGQELLGSL